METFEQSGLNNSLLRSIQEMGFERPTPVQEKTIPAILFSKQDLVALAQTGTGKTAGFGLPILQQLSPDSKFVQSLILCPTRELCLQICNELNRFAKHTKNISIVAVYGGANITAQMKDIKKGANIIVGTPGRTLDLIKRKIIKLEKIEWLVLDEADEMLNMGFKEDLDLILETTPKNKQTLLFSATMPKGVWHIAEKYMNNPTEISIGKKNTGAVNVEHHYYMVRASDRYIALKRIADINLDIYGIVFCRTRQETKDIASKLMQDGYNADALHGDLSQAQRDQVMQRFRTKHLQILVATDVAARGLDINELTHIVNYNLPDDPEVYIHRSGRTGRAGNKGISVAIIHSREGGKLREIENLAQIKFHHKLIPGGREICEKRLFNLINKVEKVEVDENQINTFLADIYKKLDWLNREELIKRFVSVEFNRFLEYYKNSGDINVQKDESRKSDKKKKNDRKLSRFFINIGSKDKLKAPNLIGLINELTDSNNIEIGKIEILKSFSFFEADKNYESIIIDTMNNVKYGGSKLVVELSKSPKKKTNKPENNKFGRKERWKR